MNNHQREDGARSAERDADAGTATRARSRRIPWRCRLLGHAGEWSRARTDGVHWFSRCPRCHQQVVRDCSGGGWRAATTTPEASNGG